MIPTPICLLSRQCCNKFCFYEECNQSAFICQICPEKQCLNRHFHNNKIKYIQTWSRFTPLLQKINDKNTQSKQELLQNLLLTHKISPQKIVKFKESDLSDQIIQAIKKIQARRFDEMTGKQMGGLLKILKSNEFDKNQLEVKKLTQLQNENSNMIIDDRITYNIDQYLINAEERQQFNRYNSQIRLNPQNSEGYYNRGVFYQRKNQNEKALNDYNKAIKYNPRHSNSYNNRGYIYYFQNQLEKAMIDYDKAIQYDPFNPKPYLNRGRLYIKQNQMSKGLADYEQSIKCDPNYAKAYHNKGILYESLNQLDLALQNFTKAILCDPRGNSYSYNGIGLIYHRKKQFARALNNYNKAIQCDIKYYKAYINRGNLYKDIKQFKKSLIDYNHAIQYRPQCINAHYNRGLVYQQMEQFDQAILDYNKFIQSRPESPQGYHLRGCLYKKMKQPENALQDFNKCIQINPDYFKIYQQIGTVYYQLQKFQEAEIKFKKCIQKSNDNYSCHLSYFYLGKIHLKKKLFKDSYQLLTKAIESSDHNNSNYYLYRGIVNYCLEEYNKSDDDYARMYNTYLNGNPIMDLRTIYIQQTQYKNKK